MTMMTTTGRRIPLRRRQRRIMPATMPTMMVVVMMATLSFIPRGWRGVNHMYFFAAGHDAVHGAGHGVSGGVGDSKVSVGEVSRRIVTSLTYGGCGADSVAFGNTFGNTGGVDTYPNLSSGGRRLANNNNGDDAYYAANNDADNDANNDADGNDADNANGGANNNKDGGDRYDETAKGRLIVE